MPSGVLWNVIEFFSGADISIIGGRVVLQITIGSDSNFERSSI